MNTENISDSNETKALSQDAVSKSFESGIDVKIIGKKANHPFDIGEIVTLVEKEKSGLWKAYNENRGNWWINEEDANVC